MVSRQQIARIALRTAFEARQRADVPLGDPICIYDFVEKFGLEVWFVPGGSFGGMYVKEHNRLFVPTERPSGRRAFTCAHEFAHWWFKHGTQFDQLDFDRSDHEIPEENLANLFAGYLLMPRHAVIEALRRRRLEARNCGPIEIYSVASQLGVGYTALIKHLRWSLNLIDHGRMADLEAIPPKEIRRLVIGNRSSPYIVLADRCWRILPIDLEVGDAAVVPVGVPIYGTSVEVAGECAYGSIIRAIRPGISQARSADPQGWCAMLRVRRKHFIGRGAYRHLEDPDETELS